VKELYGEDTVIISNKRIGAQQVEVVIATDLDDGSYDLKRDPEAQVSAPLSTSLAKNGDARKVEWMQIAQKIDHWAHDHAKPIQTEEQSSDRIKAILAQAYEDEKISEEAPVSHSRPESNDLSGDIRAMKTQMKMLRDLFQTHLNLQNQSEKDALSIEAKEILLQLNEIGLDSAHIDTIQKTHLTKGRKKDFWKKTSGWIQERLVESDLRLGIDEGVFAFVGMAGVGKTTLIAKLASHFALNHQAQDVALVTLGHNRIGSKEHLKLFGMMLGVDVHHVAKATDLGPLLQQLKQKKMILIDTAGAGPRTDKLTNILTDLKMASARIKTVLTLSASVQASVNRTVCSALTSKIHAVVLTKTDETDQLGGAISTLIDSKLAFAGISSGQEIPADFSSISSQELVERALNSHENDQNEIPAEPRLAA
jgi:flagellar biosynthesis GTPase FlhF